ncbi:fibrous sheath CABYR-binding protein [Acanthochromis polyacanthus]|uniref:fibrous sheath CABYR-binding protein n=1 Tax=Acanthochromis polyacanthus TaxID=80966 RepID=UPI002233E797|nr:fibrous sheath CABYR-binding protein [Acanthochromis polyacanthus]
MLESSSETTDVTKATPGEVSLESVPDLLLESLTKSPTQPAAESPTEANFEISPPAQFTDEAVEAAAEVVMESLPENPAVNNATPEEEAALQNSVQPVPHTQPESPTYLPNKTITEESGEKSPPEQNTKEIVEVVAEVVVETLPENVVEPVNNATPEEEAALQSDVRPVIDTQSESPTHPSTETAPEGSREEAAPQVQQVSDALSKPPTQPAAETTTENNCEKCPADQGARETVRAAAEVETLLEPPAANNATPGEAAAEQPVLESPPQPAAETVVESVEGEVEPAAVEALRTTAEEVVERVVNSVVEQSVESTPDSAADRVSELNIEDPVKPETTPDTGAAQEDLAATVIKLTDALDVEPPTAESVPKPVEDSEQSHLEEPKVNQQCDDTNTSEVFQKAAQEPNSAQTLTKSGYVSNISLDEKATCCFCNEILDGRVKISLSEPLVTCHPECLKCSVCAKALGDMLTPMYLHQKEIQCGGCFMKTLKI